MSRVVIPFASPARGVTRRAREAQATSLGHGGLGLLLALAVAVGWFLPEWRDVPLPPAISRLGSAAPRFAPCGMGWRRDCVVDGDTFWMAGEKIRIADIDAPETHPPRCAEEAALGASATRRLAALLNQGAFTLVSADRPVDRYGRRLAIVLRGGQSLGDMLVNEGLARPYRGRRLPWCAA